MVGRWDESEISNGDEEINMENLKSVLMDGTVIYRNELGQYHREGGPAVVYANGDKHYYIDGKRHRDGGPAVEWANGDKEWWIDGKRAD